MLEKTVRYYIPNQPLYSNMEEIRREARKQDSEFKILHLEPISLFKRLFKRYKGYALMLEKPNWEKKEFEIFYERIKDAKSMQKSLKAVRSNLKVYGVYKIRNIKVIK